MQYYWLTCLLFLTQIALGQSRLYHTLQLSGQVRLDSLEAFYNDDMRYSDSTALKQKLAIIRHFATQKQDKALLLTADFLTTRTLFMLKQQKKEKKSFEKNLRDGEKMTSMEGKRLYYDICIAYGWYLTSERNEPKIALGYLLRADAFYRKMGYANAYGGVRKLRTIGEYYFHISDTEKSLQYFDEMSVILNTNPTNIDDYNKIHSCNDIALSENSRKHYASAIEYFKKIPSFVHHKQDSVWVGLSAGNIGMVYLGQGQPLLAEPYIKIDLAYTLKYTPSDTTVIAYDYAGMGLVAAHKKQAEISKHLFQQALNLITQYTKDGFSNALNIHLYQIEADTVLGNYADARQHTLQYYEVLMDIKQLKFDKTIQDATAKYDTERYKLNADLADNRATFSQYWAYFWFSMLTMAALSGFFVHSRNKRAQLTAEIKRKDAELEAREAKLLQAEAEQSILVEQQKNELIAINLENAQAQLQQFMDNILQKNEIIAQINTELMNLKAATQVKENDKTAEKPNEEKTDFNEILQTTILTDSEWVRFCELFENVYPAFLFHLKKDYPHLSQADLRLLVLLKLNFTTRQMATTLGISTSSVYTGRYRLRQRLADLSPDNELILLLK